MTVRAPRNGVGAFVIDRPAVRNALDRALLGDLTDYVRSIEDAIGAVVVVGADGFFSSGADLNELSGDATDLTFDTALGAAVAAIRTCSVPVIAAVEGGCYGAAVDIVAACEVVVAAQSAVFSVPAVQLGLLYDPDGVARLAGRLAPGLQSRLLLSAEPITASEAATGGLVDTLVTAGAEPEAIRLAERVADAPRRAVRATLRVLREARAGTLDPEAWQAERRALLSSPERAAAVAQAKKRLRRSD